MCPEAQAAVDSAQPPAHQAMMWVEGAMCMGWTLRARPTYAGSLVVKGAPRACRQSLAFTTSRPQRPLESRGQLLATSDGNVKLTPMFKSVFMHPERSDRSSKSARLSRPAEPVQERSSKRRVFKWSSKSDRGVSRIEQQAIQNPEMTRSASTSLHRPRPPGRVNLRYGLQARVIGTLLPVGMTV